MTNEQILKLAKTCGGDRHISKATNDIYWECDEEDLLKFALAIHEDGYNKGYDRGHDEGYEHAGNA
jgi:hypothetical protein